MLVVFTYYIDCIRGIINIQLWISLISTEDTIDSLLEEWPASLFTIEEEAKGGFN